MIIPLVLALCGAVVGCVAGTLSSLVPLPRGLLRLVFLVAPPLAAVAGFLAGWHVGARLVGRPRRDGQRPDRFDVLLGVVFPLAAALVLALLWGWVLGRPAGTFHEQGSLPLTLVILPWTAVLWLGAGPCYLIHNLRLADRLRSIGGNRDDLRCARVGSAISGLIVLLGVGLTAWRLH